jgi:phenylalanine-4-hydroxylase
MKSLPAHLQKYIVSQNYDKYTALDHAVWRYIMRQLKDFLGQHAHESYLQGLEQTGIEVEQIPRISHVSEQLEKFGWRALPVSGFLPPAAFMELQSLSILPIACDMRSLDHLLYTPAPDIVHEAAGHAPIIANPDYAEYLKQYAQVAKKAIISKEDLELYKAIRELSDIKENPNSTAAQVTAAEKHLTQVSESLTFTSEASELSRMNWWTAEYGLIGKIDSPKIFGAGLLFSVGESKWCLSDKVKKIPLSIECIQQSYDITEPQPHLFVARDFAHLTEVLEELSAKMAYRTGGVIGLQRALQAESINTVEFENKLQISGVLKSFKLDENSNPIYLQFNGPSQLSFNDVELTGHGNAYHAQGYGTPLGSYTGLVLSEAELGQTYTLNYTSGVKVTGTLSALLKASDQAFVLSFKNAVCEYKSEKLFLPEWGTYDVIVAQKITSVFAGPADRSAFGDIDDFVASRVPEATYTDAQKKVFLDYQELRNLRNSQNINEEKLVELFAKFKEQTPQEWLLFVELFELAIKTNINTNEIEKHLLTLPQKDLIHEGVRLAHAKL